MDKIHLTMPLAIALTLWEMGLVSDANLLAWADAQILKQTNPPIDLLELSAQGPHRCLNNSAFLAQVPDLTIDSP